MDLVANEIVVMSAHLKSNSLEKVMAELNHNPPLNLIVGLRYAMDTEKIKLNTKKGNFKVDPEVSPELLLLPESAVEMDKTIEYLVTSLNREEQDVAIEELRYSYGVPFSEEYLKMLVDRNSLLSRYECEDPGNKGSIYTFITLTANLDQKWGMKQFIKKGKKK